MIHFLDYAHVNKFIEIFKSWWYKMWTNFHRQYSNFQ